MTAQPGSGGLANRILLAAILFLLASLAVNWAICLLAEVWVGIVIVGIGVVMIAFGIDWWRRQRSGW